MAQDTDKQKQFKQFTELARAVTVELDKGKSEREALRLVVESLDTDTAALFKAWWVKIFGEPLDS